MNKPANVLFKKVVDTPASDLVVVFADEQCIKSFKKILVKEESALKPQKTITTRRFDLIHFDAVLVNLLKNRHSSEYSLVSEQTLEDLCTLNSVNPLFLHKIYVNDPVLVYHGF